MKITESQLRQIIREAINEYRSSQPFDRGAGHDGDHWYVRPNGETPEWQDGYMGNAGKRGNANMAYRDFNGEEKRGITNDATIFSHGKGRLCHELLAYMNDIFFGNKKIMWTDDEMGAINDIYMSISDLARLTKQEGNKKRGYMSDAAEE